MSKIFSIPSDLVFSPCKVDGHFWSQFHTLLSYLGDLESLMKLKNDDPEAYSSVIEPLIRFVAVTEEELGQKGHLIEIDQSDLIK